MKKFTLIFTTVVSFIIAPFSAFAANCPAIEADIAQKIINNGVPEGHFQLEAIPVEQAQPEGWKVVGQCSQGKKKIMYRREAKIDAAVTENIPVNEDAQQPELDVESTTNAQ